MKTSENLPDQDLLPMEYPSMSSQGGSPAKTLALQEGKLASGMEQEAAYGPKSCDLLASYDHATSSWRTSQTCLVALLSGEADGLAEYSETWPSAGMMRNGIVFRLPMLVPGIGGTEFGWLPTPTKSDAKGSPRNRWNGSAKSHGNLCEILRNGQGDPIYPHPDFVTQMMGFPTGWTDLHPSETQSSLKSPNSLAAPSCKPKE
jgi:hypothetical protein